MASQSKEQRQVRFEATLHRGERQKELKAFPGLGLDRLPSPPDEVRVLITADEAARLVELGFEVHLLRAQPIRPLDGALVQDDDSALEDVKNRVRGIERRGGE